MAPYITQVHIKDAIIIKDGMVGRTKPVYRERDLPIREMLYRLLALGDDKPQVTSFGLEEEVDYYAPAFRFDNEGNNPWIPWRTASYTPLPNEDAINELLMLEKEYALAQIEYIKNMCNVTS